MNHVAAFVRDLRSRACESLRRLTRGDSVCFQTSHHDRMFVSLSCGGTTVVGHDRIDEFLVVRLATQCFNLRDSSTSKHLGIPCDAHLTRTLRMWQSPVERPDKLLERGNNAPRHGCVAACFLAHWENVQADRRDVVHPVVPWLGFSGNMDRTPMDTHYSSRAFQRVPNSTWKQPSSVRCLA
jgi:hypothetical protein